MSLAPRCPPHGVGIADYSPASSLVRRCQVLDGWQPRRLSQLPSPLVKGWSCGRNGLPTLRMDALTSGLEPTAAAHPNTQGEVGEYEGQTAVVIGAGPAGSCAAYYLARRGFSVKVFERRGDPDVVPATNHRSIIIVLRQETLAILKRLGVKLPEQEEDTVTKGLTRFKGVATWTAKGITKGSAQEGRTAVLAERHSIARSVLKAVGQQYPDRIQFCFDHQCEGIDFDNRIAQFKVSDGSIHKEEYDLLIGADGARSAVRRALANHDSMFNVETRDVTRVYKSLRGLPLPEQEEFKDIVQMGRMAFVTLKQHRHNGKKTPARITIYGAEDGNVNGIMSYYLGDLESIHNREEDWLRKSVPQEFPKPWIDTIANQIRASPESVAGPVTRCSSFVGPRALLMGDAAHSVTPAMGIGCNMAIEDAMVLDNALEKGRGSAEVAVEEFNLLRYKDVQDAQDLQETIPGAGIQASSFTTPFIRAAAGLHLAIFMLGHKFLPWIIPNPVYMRFVAGKVTASQALQRIRKEAFVLAALAAALVALALQFCIRRLLCA